MKPDDTEAEALDDTDDREAREQITLILEQASRGDSAATDELLPIVYDELRRLASWRLKRERPGQTLQATALVHEAYLRLLGDDQEPTWENRRHFFAAAAESMRRILIDRARRKGRQKHGGGLERAQEEALDFVEAAPSEVDVADVLGLDDALTRLEKADPEAALVTKLRHYSGFTVNEIAEAVGMSARSVDRKWSLARAWLLRELSR